MPTGETLLQEHNFITLMLLKKLGHRDRVALRKPEEVLIQHLFLAHIMYMIVVAS